MDPITEIRRIEEELYQFRRRASEADRLVRQHLGLVCAATHIPEDEHEAEVEELQDDLKQSKIWLAHEEKLTSDIRDAIQQAATKNFPDPDALLTRITALIHAAETDIVIDDDAIFSALDRAALRPGFSSTVVFSDTRPATLSEFRQPLPSLPSTFNVGRSMFDVPLPSPTTTPHDRDAQTDGTPTVRAPRRLPGIRLGGRAA